MLSNSSAQFTQLNRLRESLGEVRASQRETGRFFVSVFDALQKVANNLVRQQQAWQAERDKAENELRRQAMEIDAQRAELDAKLRKIAPTENGPDNKRLQSLLRTAEKERTMLEAELETIRRRAGDMAKAAKLQNRQMESQQTEWSIEFRQLKSLLEDIRDTLADNQNNNQTQKPEPDNADGAVLDSVLAQFQIIQKDVARRRSKKGP